MLFASNDADERVSSCQFPYFERTEYGTGEAFSLNLRIDLLVPWYSTRGKVSAGCTITGSDQVSQKQAS